MLSATATESLAIGLLGAMALAAVGGVVVLYLRSPYTPAQAVVFAINYLVARLWWRVEIIGRLPIPPGQGAVIVCNHRSPSDPSFIAVAAGRLVHWMVAKEYCEHPVMGWFLRVCEVIPTSRGGVDTAATKLAIRYAQSGGLVGMFPEGRINTTAEPLLPGRQGAALVALKARVPVVPCYVSGSRYGEAILSPLLMPAKVHLHIGRPIDLSPYFGREDEREVLEEVTARFLKEIASLGGQPHFEPRLAGRNHHSTVGRTSVRPGVRPDPGPLQAD